MKDNRTPEQIWEAACQAMIINLKEWGYRFPPFIRPVPYLPEGTVQLSGESAIVRLKAEFEPPHAKGARYHVVGIGNNTYKLKNANDNHPEATTITVPKEQTETV